MHLETTTSLELDSTELEEATLELDSTELEDSTLELDSTELEEATLELDSTELEDSSLELDSGSTLELETTTSPQDVSTHHQVWEASSLIHCGTPSLTRAGFMV